MLQNNLKSLLEYYNRVIILAHSGLNTDALKLSIDSFYEQFKELVDIMKEETDLVKNSLMGLADEMFAEIQLIELNVSKRN